MASASSSECCKALMQWFSRFGVCRTAVSDNGNTFVANLYKDVMRTFNVEVKFTPQYHPQSNGAIERRHQTVKNALKASLVDMGNHHQNKWMTALPWVLLGKRCAYQPDLDTSASMLAFGRSPLLPGQLLGHPGPPLNNLQTKALLEQMYLLESNPALPTSSKTEEIDISKTDNATHVYVAVDEPRGLAPRFEGPFEVISRPSRSQVEIRIGSFANGRPRLATYHWKSCKIAHLREGFVVGSRPNLGRRPNPPTEPTSPVSGSSSSSVGDSKSSAQESDVSSPSQKGGNFENELSPEPTPAEPTDPVYYETLGGKKPHPEYLKKGPIFTKEMLDKWPSVFSEIPGRYPKRASRNQHPVYN